MLITAHCGALQQAAWFAAGAIAAVVVLIVSLLITLRCIDRARY